ncbi:MAG: hypothetical protein M1833_001301 [Piccolia ochrophora]|nr:MAG: hypothetical protein M1833_001301 [Piccolia ochrophora]
MFMNREELMPPEETPGEHQRSREEESACLERDKANQDREAGGLFRGCFRTRRRITQAIRDEDDGVDRCAGCGWELEFGRCERCGLRYGDDGRLVDGSIDDGFSDMSDDSSTGDSVTESLRDVEDLDAEIDMEDPEVDLDFDAFEMGGADYALYSAAIQHELAHSPMHYHDRGGLHNAGRGVRTTEGIHDDTSEMETADGSENSTVTDDSDDDVETESMQDFIDDGEPTSLRTSTQEEDDSDEESDEGGAVSNGVRRRVRRQAATTTGFERQSFIVDIDPTEAEDETDSVEDRHMLLRHGWSPLDHESIDDTETEDNDDSSHQDLSSASTCVKTSTLGDPRLPNALTLTTDQHGRSCGPIHLRIGTSRRSMTCGFRRRTSIAGASTTSYGSRDAHDDDSDVESASVDSDGDIDMGEDSSVKQVSNLQAAMATLQSATASLQTATATLISSPMVAPRRDIETSAAARDADTDSSSETSMPVRRHHRRSGFKAKSYNPQLSTILAQHQSQTSIVNSGPSSTDSDALSVESGEGTYPPPRFQSLGSRTASLGHNSGDLSSLTPATYSPFQSLTGETLRAAASTYRAVQPGSNTAPSDFTFRSHPASSRRIPRMQQSSRMSSAQPYTMTNSGSEGLDYATQDSSPVAKVLQHASTLQHDTGASPSPRASMDNEPTFGALGFIASIAPPRNTLGGFRTTNIFSEEGKRHRQEGVRRRTNTPTRSIARPEI